jgi:peptide/nickel transport system substrate-binding protein
VQWNGTRALVNVRRIAALTGAVLILLACGPAAPTAPAPSVGENPQSSVRTGPKSIVMGFRSSLSPLLSYGRPLTTSTEPNEHWFMFHANLSTFDVDGNVVPLLAQKVPSTSDGDWKVGADGSMEVTWKLRPDAKWHDGTPLTAQDFAFGYEILRDPKLTVGPLGDLSSITRVEATDPQTFVVTWRTLSQWGAHNGMWGIPPLPRHLLEELYRTGDTEAFENSPIWGPQWVGLGPFRVTSITPGVELQAEAFDSFVLGRPKIDRVTFRIIPDLQVLQTNVMAGTVDVVTPGASLKPEHIFELQRTWANDGEAFTIPVHGRTLFLQWREPTAPWVEDLRFRQALIHSMDRAEWVDALQSNLTEVLHYYAAADDPLNRLAAQRGIVKYDYDPTRAQRLFAEAGWNRGADGLLRNAAGRTVPFLCCRQAAVDAADNRESLAMVDVLKKAGIQAEHPLPDTPAGLSAADARKFTTLNKQGQISPYRFSEQGWFLTQVGSQSPSEENRWVGANTSGWSSPAYDGLYEQMRRTLEAGPRQELQLQLLKMIAEELPVIPLWYEPLGVVYRKGLVGINRRPHSPPLTAMTTWNVYTWDLRS